MPKIQVVRGAATEEPLAGRVLDFWARHGALTGQVARDRLRDLVCIIVDDDDEILGVNSVFEQHVSLIGGRFWLYRRFVAGSLPEGMDGELLARTFDVLEAERSTMDSGPAGLCVLVADREAMRRRPEAVWPDSELFYAGYLPDGQQVRIRYFAEAQVA